jgi:hypothetical protein
VQSQHDKISPGAREKNPNGAGFAAPHNIGGRIEGLGRCGHCLREIMVLSGSEKRKSPSNRGLF